MGIQYLEEFAIGQTFGSKRHVIDKEQIVKFAQAFDPQPFHLDEVAARSSLFGGLAASGWHTAAITMRLLAGSELQPAGGLIGAGFDAALRIAAYFFSMKCPSSRAMCWKRCASRWKTAA